jgi:hypothetical protein
MEFIFSFKNFALYSNPNEKSIWIRKNRALVKADFNIFFPEIKLSFNAKLYTEENIGYFCNSPDNLLKLTVLWTASSKEIGIILLLEADSVKKIKFTGLS